MHAGFGSHVLRTPSPTVCLPLINMKHLYFGLQGSSERRVDTRAKGPAGLACRRSKANALPFYNPESVPEMNMSDGRLAATMVGNSRRPEAAVLPVRPMFAQTARIYSQRGLGWLSRKAERRASQQQAGPVRGGG